MARTVVIQVTDDFDSSQEAEVSRVIGWEGYDYYLDLTGENDKELQEILQPYLEAAHERVKQPKKYKTKPSVDTIPPKVLPKPASAKMTPEKRAEIREWAASEGLSVSKRGSIAKAVIDAYNEAH